MGKGDKKSKKGKIWIGSYGVRRPKKKKNAFVAQPVAKETKKAVKVEEAIESQVVVEEKAKKVKKETAPKAVEAEAAEPKVKKTAEKKAPAKKAEPKDDAAEKPKAKKTAKKE